MKKGLKCLALVLPFILSGCSDNSTDEAPFSSQKISVKVDVSEIDDTEETTRGTDVNTFDIGDIIYVGKLSHSDNTRQTSVAYTFSGTEFNGELTWDFTRETLYAFKRGDGGGNLYFDFSVKSDQSVLAGRGVGLINSDFLFSAERENYYSAGTTATLNNFVHKVSKVVVNIGCDDESLLTSCNLGGGTLYMKASVASNGNLTAKDRKNGTIQMYHRPGTKSFEAFVIPQITDATVSDFITFVYNGNTYHYPLSKSITFSAGTSHTIEIKSLKDCGSFPKLHLYDVTTDHIGWVLCTDGSVYENIAVATTLFGYSTNEIIGMIGYVGTGLSCAHGILVALQDSGTDNDRYYNNVSTTNGAWGARGLNTLGGSSRVTLGGWTVFTDTQWKVLMKQCSAAYVNRYGVVNPINVDADSDTPVAMWALMRDCGGTGATALIAGGQHWTNQTKPSTSDGTETSWTAKYFTATGWATCSDRWICVDSGSDYDEDSDSWSDWESWDWRPSDTAQAFAVRAVRTF